MRVVTGEEASLMHDLYREITDSVIATDLDNRTIVSVLLKITACLALAEQWDREELMHALGHTYDMEKFLNPTLKEKH
jgi:hypothetical protein